MKKIKALPLTIVFLLASFLLTACQIKTASSNNSSSTDGKLFGLKLYSDKQEYKPTEKINIWSTLEYTGDDIEIQIWHGDPCLIYTISDGKDFNLVGNVDEILKSTILQKGRIYKNYYEKSGGYAAEDPRAGFWKKFFAEKDLYLPPGEYEIKVSTAFSLNSEVAGSEYRQSAEIKIKVSH